MNMQIDLEKGIANVGDVSRMKEVMARARRGEQLVIGFIGGSITQGSLSSTPQTCYAYRVYTWWKETFPQAEFVYCNAGIGGTTSEFGAARVGTDLLAERPDFVIVICRRSACRALFTRRWWQDGLKTARSRRMICTRTMRDMRWWRR